MQDESMMKAYKAFSFVPFKAALKRELWAPKRETIGYRLLRLVKSFLKRVSVLFKGRF